MKTCTSCNETKSIGAFWRDVRRPHGRVAKCKVCRSDEQKAARRADPEKQRRINRRHYHKNKDSERERHLVRKYGVTLKDYHKMFMEQSGKCAVCGNEQDRSFDVDHDHKTGAVRGLLCTNCNRMIGHARDNPETLEAAAIYLKKSSRSVRRSSSRRSKKQELRGRHR